MDMTPVGFRFAPSILVRLGEELVPNLDQAIIELIRNSYDADANLCTVELKYDKTSGSTITVSDDGSGMLESHIKDNWLVLGGSSKESAKLTPMGRRTVGDKGLGRLSALRAGTSVEMCTRHFDQPPEGALSINIDWSLYATVNVVEDVPLSISAAVRENIGTTTTLKGIKRALGRAETDRLGRSIVLLTSPFSDRSAFRVDLIAPDFPELEARVRNGYLDDAEYRLRAKIFENGTGIAEVLDFKGDLLYSAPSEEWIIKKSASNGTYDAPLPRLSYTAMCSIKMRLQAEGQPFLK